MDDTSENILSITAFKRTSADALRRRAKTDGAIMLTINGEAEFVLQDVASYLRLLDIKEQYETRLAIDQGLDDVRNGKHRPAAETFSAMRRELPSRHRSDDPDDQ